MIPSVKALSCCISFAAVCTFASFGQAAPKRPTGLPTPGIQSPMAAIKPLAIFAVPGAPDWMAVAQDSVWVTSSPKNTVTQLKADTNTLGHIVTVAKPCSGLIFAFGSIWSPSCGEHSLVRFNAVSGAVEAKITVGPAESEGGIAAGAGSLWMLIDKSGVLARINPKTNTVERKIAVPAGSAACTFGGGIVWVTAPTKGLLASVDPLTNSVTHEIEVGQSPRFLTFGAGSVWTLNQGDGTVSRIDASTYKLVANIEAGLQGEGGEITFGQGALWTTLIKFPITKIDPATNKVSQQWTGPGGDSIRIGLGSLWLTDYQGQKVWRIDPNSL